MNCAVTAFFLQFIVLAVVANWVWDVRSAGCKMYSAVRLGSYQLSLSEGLAEGHRSAMHQHTALLSHLAVTALRPAVERRDRGETELHESQKFRHRCGRQSHPTITRGVVTFPPTRCSSRALPGGWSQSRHAAQRACRGVPLSKHTTPCVHS